jgi:hypothetical protein
VKFAIVKQVEIGYVEMETLEQAQQAYTFLNQSYVFVNRLLIHPSRTHDRITVTIKIRNCNQAYILARIYAF